MFKLFDHQVPLESEPFLVGHLNEMRYSVAGLLVARLHQVGATPEKMQALHFSEHTQDAATPMKTH